jgi:peptide/nickel transport system permease protein
MIMQRYIIKRLLQLIPILIGITLLTFLLMNVSSIDAVDIMEQNTGGNWSEAQKELMRQELGLNLPLPLQYLRWLFNLLHGDMGVSYISGRPVFSAFMEKLPATIYLTITSIVLTIIISIPLGIISAVRQNKVTDYIIRFLSFIGNSLPNFFVALLLIYIFALKLGLLPVMGNAAGWKSVILPTLTLAIAMAAKYTRQVRATVLEELNQDYVTGARARGIPERRILYFNVLKSSMLTIVTLLALSIGSLLGGTAIVESIFLWDGVGKLAVDAIMTRDYPIIQAYVIWMAIIYVAVNLVTDIVYHYLDPRIRLQEMRRKPVKRRPGIRKQLRFAQNTEPDARVLSNVQTGYDPDHISVRKQKVKRDYAKIRLIVFLILVGIVLIIAAFASHLTPYDPYAQDLSVALQPPGNGHLLGTDRYGRDMLSRVIMGSQTTIYASLLLVLIIVVTGLVVGVICGWKGGKLDTVLMRISDVFLAFPGMVFAIAVAGVLAGGLMNAVVALAAISWPKFARLARSQVLSIRGLPYIQAAKLAGSGTGKIIWKHILPNITGPIIVTAVLEIGTMIMELAGLSFLGLGATPPLAEWGSMMSNGRSMLQTCPWVVLAPGVAIFITVVLFNLLGDTVRDVMDPRSR